MPQMNPIWWFTLFIFFILHLIITNPLNYFYFSPSSHVEEKIFSSKQINWKW